GSCLAAPTPLRRRQNRRRGAQIPSRPKRGSQQGQPRARSPFQGMQEATSGAAHLRVAGYVFHYGKNPIARGPRFHYERSLGAASFSERLSSSREKVQIFVPG